MLDKMFTLRLAYEHCDIDEMSFQPDVGNITDPDLIASRDVKIINLIAPLMPTLKRLRRSTGTFDSDSKIICFHQSGNSAITDGVSETHQQLRDTPITILGFYLRGQFQSSKNRPIKSTLPTRSSNHVKSESVVSVLFRQKHLW